MNAFLCYETANYTHSYQIDLQAGLHKLKVPESHRISWIVDKLCTQRKRQETGETGEFTEHLALCIDHCYVIDTKKQFIYASFVFKNFITVLFVSQRAFISFPCGPIVLEEPSPPHYVRFRNSFWTADWSTWTRSLPVTRANIHAYSGIRTQSASDQDSRLW